MNFRPQYLQAMREKAPALFKRLSKSGKLDHSRFRVVVLQAWQCHRCHRELLT
jgi:hypothetical protein